ncbi:sensor histidine kinase [Sphingomonas sp. CJ20]
MERLPIWRDRPVLTVAATLGMVALALGLRLAVDRVMPPGFPYLTFFPAVLVASFLFGAELGAVSAVLCGLCAWYFFIPPVHTLTLSLGSGVALTFYAFVTATDIAIVHWMQKANGRLRHARERNRALADIRELLFRELQHRVSNNLQVAAGLLTLQKRHIADPDARAALDESARRIGVIGRISRQLYRDDGGQIPLGDLLGPLIGDVVESWGKRIDVAIHDPAALLLAPDAAVPVALVVAESVANAIEHGFAGREDGRITVTCARAGQELRISVHDDGAGLKPDFEAPGNASLGLGIARMLADQLGGRFELRGGAGTTALLAFPA